MPEAPITHQPQTMITFAVQRTSERDLLRNILSRSTPGCPSFSQASNKTWVCKSSSSLSWPSWPAYPHIWVFEGAFGSSQSSRSGDFQRAERYSSGNWNMRSQISTQQNDPISFMCFLREYLFTSAVAFVRVHPHPHTCTRECISLSTRLSMGVRASTDCTGLERYSSSGRKANGYACLGMHDEFFSCKYPHPQPHAP